MTDTALFDRAARIAPALRTLLSKDGTPCTLSFCPKITPPWDLLLSAEEPEALLDQLPQRLTGIRPQRICIEGFGIFEVQDLPASRRQGRLDGKVVLITGAAQGFGKEIADLLTREGAHTVYADRNGEGAQAAAREINRQMGAEVALGVCADVCSEQEVNRMFREAVLSFGGVDVFISNAGIAKAGSLDEMTLEEFERMAKVNYTGYFLGVKAAQSVMRLQHRFDPSAYYDIIQINSKSGLEGSNKNFAYAGSKAGGLGLTKSFAMELCPYNIKVNAVCPGNYLDGPLWSHPEKGLLLQFLRAGKVPGAKTVDDVRRAYEEKVPMRRGCTPADVVRAVLYCIEQTYETGQALPVTGGQVMLG